MKEHRTVAKWFAGLMMVGAVLIGGVAPAQAEDSGWNGTAVPPDDTSLTTTTAATLSLRDSGWNGT